MVFHGTGKASEEMKQRADDGGYFGDLLTQLTSAYPIDEHCIFATGI